MEKTRKMLISKEHLKEEPVIASYNKVDAICKCDSKTKKYGFCYHCGEWFCADCGNKTSMMIMGLCAYCK